MNARRRPPWSLQQRLVIGIVLLLAVVGVVVGAASVLALRANLLERLDEQVVSTLRYAVAPSSSDDQPRRMIGTLLVVVQGGQVRIAQVITGDGEVTVLNVAQQRRLARLDLTPGVPATVELGGSLGAYRVAGAVEDGVRALVITGLPLSEVRTTTLNLALIFGLVTAGALIVAALAGSLVVRLALRPLGRVAATATRVAELPLASGEVALEERVADADTDPHTEVGQVGAALNRMLGHVEGALLARKASEDKVRQFVADASHELRTPLASIRGYSELTRLGGHELPEDVVRALARIESESVRMTALVEDLLLLARLDEGRELVVGEVDLTQLVVDAVADAHAASPGHRWQVDAGAAPVTVAGDGARLHQVVANLLANARTHTPEGSTVEVTLRSEADTARLVVADDGPGIPEALQPVLFERFARGDGSRSRASGSTGLGLAIVAAVVRAHHGTIDVDSRPGRTRFIVSLPLRLPEVPPAG